MKNITHPLPGPYVEYSGRLDDQHLQISVDTGTRLPKLIEGPVPVVVVIGTEVLQQKSHNTSSVAYWRSLGKVKQQLLLLYVTVSEKRDLVARNKTDASG